MRSRNIKPGFFKNEILPDCSDKARLLFIGLWCYCDREGKFEWRPKKIKAEIFPYENPNIDKLLQELNEKNFIFKYEIYGLILNFLRHQNPHPHEAKSTIPNPDENTQYNQCHGVSITLHEMSTKCNADSLIPDIRIPDIKSNEKNTFGEFKNVQLTSKEYEKLLGNYGSKIAHEKIENLSQYMESKGKKYKSHYATILTWSRGQNGNKGNDTGRPNLMLERIRQENNG